MQRLLADTRARFDALAATAQARLARTTPRERLLLFGLVGGILIYAPVAALDWRAAQEEAYVDALIERGAARTARAAAQRINAASADALAVEDMETWGFEGSNAAVVRVRIERRLREAIEDAGLQNATIEVDEEPEDEGPTRWLGARVEAELRWRPTFAFLDGLTGWPEGFVVKGFEYEGYNPGEPPPPSVDSRGRPRPAPPNLAKVRIALAFPVDLPPVAATEPTS